jgi:hypothetical protein
MDSTKQEQHISEREFDFLTIVSNVTCYCNQSSFNKTVHKWHASRIKFVAATFINGTLHALNSSQQHIALKTHRDSCINAQCIHILKLKCVFSVSTIGSTIGNRYNSTDYGCLQKWEKSARY